MFEGMVDFQVPVAGLFCLGKLGARSSFLATLMGWCFPFLPIAYRKLSPAFLSDHPLHTRSGRRAGQLLLCRGGVHIVGPPRNDVGPPTSPCAAATDTTVPQR